MGAIVGGAATPFSVPHVRLSSFPKPLEAKLKSLQASTKQIFEAIRGTDELVNKQNTIITKLKEDLKAVNTMYETLVHMVVKSR